MATLGKVLRINKGDKPTITDKPNWIQIGSYPEDIFVYFDSQEDLQRFAGELAVVVSEQGWKKEESA